MVSPLMVMTTGYLQEVEKVDVSCITARKPDNGRVNQVSYRWMTGCAARSSISYIWYEQMDVWCESEVNGTSSSDGEAIQCCTLRNDGTRLGQGQHQESQDSTGHSMGIQAVHHHCWAVEGTYRCQWVMSCRIHTWSPAVHQLVIHVVT